MGIGKVNEGAADWLFWIRFMMLLVLVIFLGGCNIKSTDGIILGEYNKITIYTDYGEKNISEITDVNMINKLVRKINSSSKMDVSDVTWERGPDGKLLFENEKQSLTFAFFSDQSAVDVFRSEKHKHGTRLYRMDTNFYY